MGECRAPEPAGMSIVAAQPFSSFCRLGGEALEVLLVGGAADAVEGKAAERDPVEEEGDREVGIISTMKERCFSVSPISAKTRPRESDRFGGVLK